MSVGEGENNFAPSVATPTYVTDQSNYTNPHIQMMQPFYPYQYQLPTEPHHLMCFNQYNDCGNQDTRLLKELKLQMYQSNTKGIHFVLTAENYNQDPLPSYLCQMPSVEVQMSNTPSNPRIYYKQTFYENDSNRNQIISKYINEITQYNQTQISEAMVMPLINKLKRNPTNDSIDTSDTFDTPPKKRRKLADSEWDTTDIITDNKENMVNPMYKHESEESDNDDFDLFKFAMNQRELELDRLKKTILSEMDMDNVKCGKCQKVLDICDGDCFLNGNVLSCDECDTEMMIGIPKSFSGKNKDEPLYEIRKIHGKIVVYGNGEKRNVFYLAEWKGYDMSECSWLNEVNFHESECIKEFNQQLIQNENSVCDHDEHNGYSVVPCWTHGKRKDTKKLKDLTHCGIKYELSNDILETLQK